MTLLILAAVSGTGKSTVGHALRARNSKLKLSVSHTTRSAREGERDGEHYHFVSRETFKDMIEAGGFAEWAEYVGNLYGTAMATVEQAAALGDDLFFDIEMVGARQLKGAYPDAVSIFLLPPSMGELERRLRARRTDSEAAIAERLERGRAELLAARDFDYLVINDDLEEAVGCVERIYRGQTDDRTAHRAHLEGLIKVNHDG